MTESDTLYFANKSLSKSAIDKLLECPALYKAWLEGEDEEKTSAALAFGSLSHLLTLQPQEFDSQYAVTDLNLATKEGKAWKAALPEGIQIVKNDDYEKAQMMADAVRDHPQAKMLFQDYIAEEPIYWTFDGVPCKAKPDIVAEVFGRRYIADLKTTESVNPEAIRKSIAKWGYHRQAAWYLSGMEAVGRPCDAFIFIFVEKTYPYLVTMCQLDEDALAKGMEECLRAVSTLKECQASGTWPCYTREIITLGLPKWAA